MNHNDSDKSKKNKDRNITSIILGIISVICIEISVYGLYSIYKDYKVADDIYQNAKEEFVTLQNETDDHLIEEPLERGPWYEMITVDITALKGKYPDIVGWIYFEDGLISYPVMQADDNEKYLHIAYNGKESKSGSIFMGANYEKDFSDTHTLIYGHNMKNLSMFGRLKYYKTKSEYYKEHAYFQIVRENEILRYQIFAYQDVPVDSFVYRENFTSAKELSKRLLQGSYVNPGLDIKDEDKIITLSTCTSDDMHRFIVSAVLIERYPL